ncbi:MAG: DUF4012 domain-containing protein, partial [Candidatus Nanopelagicales bacterium]
VQDAAAQAHGHTEGPLWWLAAKVPFVGPNFAAIGTVSEVIDELATRALPSLVDVAGVVGHKGLIVSGGRIDVARLQAAAPLVASADAELITAQQQLSTIDVAALNSHVSTPILDLEAKLDDIAGTTAAIRRALTLLPAMLGADGPRTYLVMLQNNAEVRATGGLPGSWVEMQVSDGAVKILDIRPSAPVTGDDPILPLTVAEQALYGDQLVIYPQDTNFTPDFPRTAQLSQAFWKRETGRQVDGVFSLDTVALSHILAATGPVTLPDGTKITASNAVSYLLSDVYAKFAGDPQAHHAYFAEVSRAVFAAIATGQVSSSGMLDALAASENEGRLYAWSAHPQEQSLLTETGLSGALVGHVGDAPVVGVFLNDSSGAKMSYYLRTAVRLNGQKCLPDGQQAFTVTVTLTSTAPQDAATSLPQYVTGGGQYIRAGDVATGILVFSPSGGKIDKATVGDQGSAFVQQVQQGDHWAVTGSTELAPGQSITMTVQMHSGEGQPGVPLLRKTPGIADPAPTITALRCP